jgi:hypothetical protein
MGTTTRQSTGGARGRASGRGHDPADVRDEFDLLTAMVLGVAVGVGATLLLRRGPSGRRPAAVVARAAGKGARQAGEYGLEGARWAAKRGADLVDRVPVDEIGEELGSYLASARDAINEAVAEEVRDLRKAIRRKRKQIGV